MRRVTTARAREILAAVARHVLLLRGINLGARRRVPMARLREVLTSAGYEDVRTHLQSGNVVLTSPSDATTLERDGAQILRAAFGFEIAVMVRTRDELAAAVAADPFGDEADDPARYQVSFLAGYPDPAGVEDLLSAEIAPERVAVRGREVYAWHPGGVGRSELAKLITERRLGVAVTARNWRTVTKLLELAHAPV